MFFINVDCYSGVAMAFGGWVFVQVDYAGVEHVARTVQKQLALDCLRHGRVLLASTRDALVQPVLGVDFDLGVFMVWMWCCYGLSFFNR